MSEAVVPSSAGKSLRALGRPAARSVCGSVWRSRLHAAQSPVVWDTAASPVVAYASAAALSCGASAFRSAGDRRLASTSRRLASLPGARWSVPLVTTWQSNGKTQA